VDVEALVGEVHRSAEDDVVREEGIGALANGAVGGPQGYEGRVWSEFNDTLEDVREHGRVEDARRFLVLPFLEESLLLRLPSTATAVVRRRLACGRLCLCLCLWPGCWHRRVVDG
jgi:hypothetical protein